QVHACAPLGDAVTHGGHPTRELGDATGLGDCFFDTCRVVLERLVCGQHVVVGGHDRQVRCDLTAQSELVGRSARGEAVREVCTSQCRACGSFVGGGGDLVEVGGAGLRAAFDETSGHFGDDGMGICVRGHGGLLLFVPRRGGA